MQELAQRWLVVGAGSFGTAFAHILARAGREVVIAARSADQAGTMQTTRVNDRYLPSYQLHANINVVSFEQALEQQFDACALAVPSAAMAQVLERFQNVAPTFVSLSKGMDGDGRLPLQCAADVIDPQRIVALSGPNIAVEIVNELPTAAVVAGGTEHTRGIVQRSCRDAFLFRVYQNDDAFGVEFAGACKNVVAIGAGICEQMGYGHNGLAALLSRGLGEVARLGVQMGARLDTFLGLAGMGDLVATCTSPFGRNRRAGLLLAQGLEIPQIREQIGQTVEGLRTAPYLADLAEEHGVQMRICSAVAAVAKEFSSLSEAIEVLTAREPLSEWELPLS